MARTDNFEHFLTDVADAIREKTGITHPLSPASYDTLIRGILPIENTPDDSVRFFDYDGTLIHSFKKHDFLMRIDMPELPEHLGMVNIGWNWSFDALREQIYHAGTMDVGCSYYMAENKFKMVVEIPSNDYEVSFYQVMPWIGAAFGNEDEIRPYYAIDWGDGSDLLHYPFKYNGTSYAPGHVYAQPGRYTITFLRTYDTSSWPRDYMTFWIQRFSDPDLIVEMYYPQCASTNQGYGLSWEIEVTCGSKIEKLIYGVEDTGDNPYPLTNVGQLETLIIPKSVQGDMNFLQAGDTDWARIDDIRPGYEDIWSSWENDEGETVYYKYVSTAPLKLICFPERTRTIEDGVGDIAPRAYLRLEYCRTPLHPDYNTIPSWRSGYIEDIQPIIDQIKGATTIAGQFLYESFTRFSQTINLPEGITSIQSYFMHEVELYHGAVITINMPSTITEIGDSFCRYEPVVDPDSSWWDPETDYEYGYILVDFRKATQVPVLHDYQWPGWEYTADKFITIVVPDELYKEWTEATNWATFYKDRIVKASVYEASLES